jgi:signal transduction histidine kinase
MASRASIVRLAALLGLCVVAIFGFESLVGRHWASCVLAALVLCGLVLALLRRDRPPFAAQPEPSPATASNAGDPGFVVLMDQLPIPLLKFAPHLGLHAVNRAARDLFRTDDLIVDAPEALVAAVERPQAGASSPLRLFDRAYAVGVSELLGDQGATRWISLTDIQSEVRIAEATALRDLLRVLSHEIMNSLTPVASLAGVARTCLEAESSAAARSAMDALDVLVGRASALTRFVEAYRSMARLPDPVLRPVQPGAVVRDVVRVFARGAAARGVSIDVDVPPDLPWLDLDETLFAQALLNILANAAEATRDNRGARRVRLSVDRSGQDLRIAVADNGSGVPEDLRRQLFHTFVTTKPNGTGTGLNLARQIALAQGGDLIWFEGEGEWTTVFAFTFGLPPAGRGASTGDGAED